MMAQGRVSVRRDQRVWVSTLHTVNTKETVIHARLPTGHPGSELSVHRMRR